MVSKYENIPQQDFLTLIHLIQPNTNDEEIKKLLDEYVNVSTNTEVFSEFIDRNFPDSEDRDKNIDSLFRDWPLSREKFNQIFTNRKTAESQETYYKFVTCLLKFKHEKTEDNLFELLELSKNDRIKKAFGFGKSVFKIDNSVNKFLELNGDNILLSKNNKAIYGQFVLSKKDDIVREYRDMTKRTFNLTGLFNFSNGLVNTNNTDVLRIVFGDISLSGESSDLEIHEDVNSNLYRDISIVEILDMDKLQIVDTLKNFFKLTSIEQIEDVVSRQKEVRFRKLIREEFPREKILELLPLFTSRNDKKIQEEVSEFATVPTIFEYVIAIAWFHISSQDFSITRSLNLTLDGNMKPLSHAPGGAGDIIVEYEDLTLMLEVTLMNRQAQKRGEWEPVLRHATNITVDKYPENVTTLFIADVLDENTINIWRSIASVPLKASNKNEYADLVKIFPMTNSEIISMLKNNSDEKKLLSVIDDSYKSFAGEFDTAWRDEILEEVVEWKD